MIIPTRFSSINYNKHWKVFIVRIEGDTPQYQLYDENGKLALPEIYYSIEIVSDKLYTVPREHNLEVVNAYDKSLKQLKDETTIYNIREPTLIDHKYSHTIW